MKNFKTSVAISIIATLGLSSITHADVNKNAVNEAYTLMDTNSISLNFLKLAELEESSSPAEQHSTSKSKDKKAKGKKSSSKMNDAKRKEKWAQKRFASIDTDSNGMIDLEEYTVLRSKNKKLKERAIKRQFNKAAGNDDQIDYDEFKATLKGKKGGKKK